MRAWLVWLGLACSPVWAQTDWLTVTGNATDPTVDTVQVDPVALMSVDDRKMMRVRVSRATERRNWDGMPYRSYESRVVFHCNAKKAEYVSATFYDASLWQGPAHAPSDYASSPKPMLFLDAKPNPTQRIIRAACRAEAG